LNSLSDGSLSKVIKFYGNENKTIYLKLPKGAYVLSASLSISGYHGDDVHNDVYDQIDDSYVNPNLWTGEVSYEPSCSIVEDSDSIGIYASSPRNSTFSKWASIHTTNLPDLEDIIEVTARSSYYMWGWYGLAEGTFDAFGSNIYSVRHSDPDKPGISNITTWIISRNQTDPSVFDVYDDGVFFKQIQPTSNKLYYFSHNYGLGGGGGVAANQNIYYVLCKHKIAPHNMYLEVGEVDHKYEWQNEGKFFLESANVPNFSAQINSYLSTCPSDVNNNCLIPITIHSDTEGKVVIANISVVYTYAKTPDISNAINIALNEGNCDCEGCLLENGCCSVPLTFYSDSAGVLNISALSVVYEPTLCNQANLDFVGSVNIADFSLFADNYLKNGEYLLGDINRDHSVDIEDLSVLVGKWLNNCSCN
jgi:hypothetical protein